MKKIACIPARYHSTRLEGKVLMDLNGKSVLERVLDSVTGYGRFDEVVVLTDHKKIYDLVINLGTRCIMTPEECTSGTDRIIHALPELTGDILINVQADEPFIQHNHLDYLIKLLSREEVAIGTLCHQFHDKDSLFDYNNVKVVKNQQGRALYFSRQVIPSIRGEKFSEWMNHHVYYKHIGIYGYKRMALEQISRMKSSSLETAEKLEQLKWLDNGMDIYVGVVVDPPIIGIDTEEDYYKALKYFQSGN